MYVKRVIVRNKEKNELKTLKVHETKLFFFLIICWFQLRIVKSHERLSILSDSSRRQKKESWNRKSELSWMLRQMKHIKMK